MANRRKVMKGNAYHIIRSNEQSLLYFFLKKLNLPMPINRMHEIITAVGKTSSK